MLRAHDIRAEHMSHQFLLVHLAMTPLHVTQLLSTHEAEVGDRPLLIPAQPTHHTPIHRYTSSPLHTPTCHVVLLHVVRGQIPAHHELAAQRALHRLVRAVRLVERQSFKPVHGILLELLQPTVASTAELVALAAEPTHHPAQRTLRVEVTRSLLRRDGLAARANDLLVGELAVEREVGFRRAVAAERAVLVELGLLTVGGSAAHGTLHDVSLAVQLVELTMKRATESNTIGGGGDGTTAHGTQDRIGGGWGVRRLLVDQLNRQSGAIENVELEV